MEIFAQTIVGHSSCSSIGCHGGLQEQGPAWNSSISTFLLNDPHARAYHLLSRADSRRIVYLYQRSVGDPDESVVQRKQNSYLAGPEYNAFINRHCANCHSSQQPSSPTTNLGIVGCESCHGPASQSWVSEHVQGRQRSNPNSWVGFIDLRNLELRAATCIKCHVGSVADKDQPYRQVTHDLIAAGHPAMRFEFSSYLASLPAHWDEARDRWLTSQGNGGGPDQARAGTFWREAWSVGKIQSTNRSIELFKDQARKIDAYKAGNTTFTRAELAAPDFAQFDCFSCHQSLSRNLGLRRAPNLGRPQWLSWHSSGLPEADVAMLKPDVDALREFSGASPPDVDEAISMSLAPSWEEAAQSYLAYYACYLDFRDASTPRGEQQPLVPNVTKDGLAMYRALLEKTADEQLLFSQEGRLQSPSQYHLKNRHATAKQYESKMTPIAVRLREMREKAAEMKIRIGK